MSTDNPFTSPNPNAPANNSGESGSAQMPPTVSVSPNVTSPQAQFDPNTPVVAGETPKATSGLAISSLVLGIISIVICAIPGLGALLGLIGSILGGVGISKASKVPGHPGKTMSIIGIVLSVIGLIIGLIVLAFTIFVAVKTMELIGDPEQMRQLQEEMQNAN